MTLRVRCGLHAGVVERRDNDYFGSAVNRAARIMGTAHGGQIVLSQAVVDRVVGRLPQAVSLRDLGVVRLRDLTHPEQVYQVVHPQLRRDFPALRSLEATPNNLPQQVSSFIGRAAVLAEIKTILVSTRLLTLVGVGGLARRERRCSWARTYWTTSRTGCGLCSLLRFPMQSWCQRPWHRYSA